jgi:hypothetical protein
MEIAVLGIDLGKNSCSVAGLYATGRIVLRRRMNRDSVSSWLRACPLASWRWRLAVARTISAARSIALATKSG